MKVRVAGTDYPLDMQLTGREIQLIKRVSGVRMAELEAALDAGDYDVLIAFAAIALQRAGKPVDVDALLDAPFGHVEFVVEEVDAPARPTRPAGKGKKATSGGRGTRPSPASTDSSPG